MSNSFDTVRISSHGGFIDEPLFIYQRLECDITKWKRITNINGETS